MVLGKMLAYFVVGLVDAALSFVSGLVVFKVPFPRQLSGARGFHAACFLFGAMFWGIFISAGARTPVVAYQMGMLTSFLPGFLLSGFVFSIDTMPKWIQVISIVVPARYFITILKARVSERRRLGHPVAAACLSDRSSAAYVFWRCRRGK